MSSCKGYASLAVLLQACIPDQADCVGLITLVADALLYSNSPDVLFVLQLKQVRPSKLSNKHLSKKNKTVHRVYGGCLDHKVVRER